MVALMLAVVFLRDIGVIAKKPPKSLASSSEGSEAEVDEEAGEGPRLGDEGTIPEKSA